jgi:hypothetical protein
MKKGKTPRQKRPRGETLLLTLSPDLKDWLAEHAKKRGASSPQEAVRQILTITRTSEQEQAA